MHYYQFNIADYRKDTVHLSRIEHSIYRDLIDWCYLNESPIPLDLEIIKRKLSIRSTDDQQALNNVLTDFFECTNDGYTQKRIQQEIDEYHLQKSNASKAGKASAKARKNKESERVLNDSSATDKPTKNHKPITNNQEQTKYTHTASPSGFAEFWSAYPRKAAKGDAEKAWKKHKPDISVCLAAIAIQKQSADWMKDGGQFIPYPATWINGERWNDVSPAATKPAQNPIFAGAI